MSELRHPQITIFYGACLEQGQACLVMEYMAQGDLSHFLKQGSHSLEERLGLALAIAKALTYLHKRGILHRDLRSTHVLVNAQGRPKLSGFGLSKMATCYVQSTQERSQALAWQAPECFAQQGDYTTASDIYSFGFVLWEMMTDQTPSTPRAEDLQRYASRGARAQIPSEVPEPIAALIRACWSLIPSERPSATQLVQSLEAYQNRPASPTAERWFEVAQQLEHDKHFHEAFEAYDRAAQRHHTKAKTCLGLFFLQGLGDMAVDKKRAHHCFLEAAQAGHPRAMYNLGRMLEKGDGVSADKVEALRWYQQAKAAGNQQASQKVERLSAFKSLTLN